ncbi:hypothetical protein MLD38_005103 [Melastoma candidum]|uniref:Uncharacterized protein n=1 Tax=Melastoma candidum TaxID=119954 RepID=A0ACB9S935_9MYRT|nr:hypothetical protein MLD38_005103 [Melastoma candidum]
MYNIIKDDPVPEVAPIIAPNVANITFRKKSSSRTMRPPSNRGTSMDTPSSLMEPGKWTPVKRKNYNLLDGVSKHTIQVFPHSWSAVMLTFDNVGMWNLRSELRRGGLLREQNRDEAIIVTDAIAADKKVNFDMNPACA